MLLPKRQSVNEKIVTLRQQNKRRLVRNTSNRSTRSLQKRHSQNCTRSPLRRTHGSNKDVSSNTSLLLLARSSQRRRKLLQNLSYLSTHRKAESKSSIAPLHPIPSFAEPFSEILIDCVGPLPKSRTGHQYLLTIMCASTRFPEAIPLRSINTNKIVEALTEFFTRYGLPRSIQTDQGTNFTSKLFEQVLKKMNIEHRMSTAYHPESQGALERFHQTLKTMLRSYCTEHEKDWNLGVPLVLFAAREAVQESLGFSPFELVFGHTVRASLKLLQESWMNST